MPLLMAGSTNRSGRTCQRSIQRCYLHHLRSTLQL